MQRYIYLILATLIAVCCRNAGKNSGQCELTFEIENGYNQSFYLENIPLADHEISKLDSVSIKDRVEKHRFIIKDKEQNLYRIRSADHRVDIVFINDADHITIKANYFEGKEFILLNTPASSSLHHFLDARRMQMESARSQQLKDSALGKVIVQAQNDYRNYVDTVASPAAAIYIYNTVDFGRDRAGLKKYIERLGKRFPTHIAIQHLVSATHDYLSIFEEELQVGDKIPDLVLPDSKGALLPLSFYKGQYLLVDFWASWDGRSRWEGRFKKQAYNQFRNRKFSIVSISLDPEKAMWEQALQKDGYEWPQLIDEKAWTGPAVMAFKFDSIPFNFLVDPTGKIIGKALYGDSLLLKLEQLIR